MKRIKEEYISINKSVNFNAGIKIGIADEDNYFNIVTTFCEGGDIYNKIQNQKGEYFSEEQIKFISACIIQSLFYLRKKFENDSDNNRYNNDYSNIIVTKASHGQADVVYYVIIN